MTKDYLPIAITWKTFNQKLKSWKKSVIQTLSSFMMFIKLPTTCTLSQNFVKMVIFTVFCKTNAKSKKKRQRLTWNRSWKESNISTWMGSSTGTWNQQIYWWKMVSVRLVILDLPKTYKTKTQSWSQLLELLCICRLSY